MIADKNSYGFRPIRSTADAIGQCFLALAKRYSAEYILEGDIRACFDQISHKWLEDNILMDSKILSKWLSAGYIEKKKLYPTTLGTPQGGVISPTLLVVTLSGLEQAIKSATKQKDKINVCIYADDFIITGASKEVLENTVKPVVEAFLSKRGLSLSLEKTKITHVSEGFDFLGMNIRKYNGKLIIKPAKSNVNRFLADIRGIIKQRRTIKTEDLIKILNPKIRGWGNYYRHVCSKETFSYVDHCIFKAIWNWAVRRHPNKGLRWVQQKYFRQDKFRKWSFSTRVKDKHKNVVDLDLIEMKKIPIKRHIKIRNEATPYDERYHKYFDKLLAQRKIVTESTTPLNWWMCWWNLFKAPNRNEKIGLPKTAL
jgi:RNA-directed DNA polymerase